MPKKTKRDKILAQHRRNMISLTKQSDTPSHPNNPDMPAQPSSYVYSLSPSKQPGSTPDTPPPSLAHLAIIKGDLIKTMMFAAIALFVEVGIFVFRR